MAYEAPTAAEIKTRFPIFADVSDPLIEAMIVEANRHVDRSWLEGDYKTAIQYLTAHMLLSEGLVTTGVTAGSFVPGGFIKSESLGDASRTYANIGEGSGSSGSDAELATTVYGRRFMALRRANHPPIVTV